MPTRREFLQFDSQHAKRAVGHTILVLSLVIARSASAADASKPIVDVRLGGSYGQITQSVGDEWAPTWGRGDVLYTGNDDGTSFGGIAASAIAFGKLEGTDPYHVKATTISGMPAYREPTLFGPEGALWRPLDSYQVGDARYRFVPCAASGPERGFCISMSKDAGRTWTAIDTEMKPLFRTSKLGAPFFIVYREGMESVMAEPGHYVYAALYAGIINGEDSYVLGRVPREKVLSGNIADWSFERTGESWVSGIENAYPRSNRSELGLDGANWKMTNAYSVDGTLYAFVTRCHYPWQSGDFRHRHVFKDSNIIKSTDDGLTWTRTGEENHNAPMFPGEAFGAPYFVWYGKDGAAAVDNAGGYVYAVSNNGHFEAGDSYVLGRVLRAKLPTLSAADWSFYKAGDGMKDASWSSSLHNAQPILEDPGQAGMTGMTYIADFHRYVIVAWHYTKVNFENAILSKDLSTVLEFFDAPKPWGPWTKIKSFETGHLGWYAPVIGQRFQTKRGPSTVTGLLYASGLAVKQEGGLDGKLYKLNYVPITLSTQRLSGPDVAVVGAR